jgi:hypothetical protein
VVKRARNALVDRGHVNSDAPKRRLSTRRSQAVDQLLFLGLVLLKQQIALWKLLKNQAAQ